MGSCLVTKSYKECKIFELHKDEWTSPWSCWVWQHFWLGQQACWSQNPSYKGRNSLYKIIMFLDKKKTITKFDLLLWRRFWFRKWRHWVNTKVMLIISSALLFLVLLSLLLSTHQVPTFLPLHLPLIYIFNLPLNKVIIPYFMVIILWCYTFWKTIWFFIYFMLISFPF